MAPLDNLRSSTGTTNFDELIKDNAVYRVPTFQRDYSWKEQNWEDLWCTIEELFNHDHDKNNNRSHCMGHIVLQSSHTASFTKTCTIIDGQQRFITLSIIAIAVIERIGCLAEQGSDDTQSTRDRQETLKRMYVGDRLPGAIFYSSKLMLNGNNNDFYQSYLVNFRKPLNCEVFSKSDQALWQAYEYFSQQLERLALQNFDQLASLLSETVAQKLLFVRIDVDTDLNSYAVLETLAAPRTELTLIDLLKNYIFSIIQGSYSVYEANLKWEQIIDKVSMENFPEFLRCWLSLKYTQVRGRNLFETVCKTVQNMEQSLDLLDNLDNYCDLYVALGDYNDEFWCDMPNSRPFVREMELFGTREAYPTLFAAYRKFSTPDFTSILEMIAVIAFRYGVVCGLNPNQLETVYNVTAIAISNNQITTPQQVFDALKAIYIQDDQFELAFFWFATRTRGQKKKLVQYILYKLEIDARDGNDVCEDSFSIEHILPENPSREWAQDCTYGQVERMIYRLGNFTPLENSLVNCKISEEKYSLKLLNYSQSAYVLTQAILAEEWTPNDIAVRQEHFAKRAVHIWKVGF
jgi:Protein of unknown function DUF262/Protein of unknown function (DUF1524)